MTRQAGSIRNRFSSGISALVAGLLLGACAAPPQAPPAAPRQAPGIPVYVKPDNTLKPGILGRNERMIVYQPGPGDTLKSIARQLLGSEELDWKIADTNGVSRAQPGQPLIVPLQPLNAVGVGSERYQTVPILCYHRFGGAAGKMSIAPDQFAAQMDWLARNDYRVIRLSQLTAFLQGREALPQRSVVITIDDGYESVYRHALPVLRKYNFPATLFAYTDFIGAGDALSWSQLQELAKSNLIDIQAHSKSHRNLIERLAGEDDTRYRQAIDAETRVPRELLEKRLGIEVRHFAYPYGDANETVLESLTRHQYQLAVTVNPGGNGFFAQPMMLRRTMIFGDYDLDTFKAKLQTSRPLAP
ncbi:polysaccharide deacetylase family protein [Piscinibacter sakaiensis]|uniref:polysaccharide deacetylase family protein n=1 Tax=Piscinibacter sakaiensis TaxID=1547922 RepID=UPI003AACEA43